jgi:hypothetical protein
MDVNEQIGVDEECANATNFEQLSNELGSRNLLIHRWVLKQRNPISTGPLDQFSGSERLSFYSATFEDQSLKEDHAHASNTHLSRSLHRGDS